MSFETWVRAQDAFGQFDVRKGSVLRDGVTLVKGYPEHVGMSGRPGKPFVSLRESAGAYKSHDTEDLVLLIEERNATAVDPVELIEIPADAKKADLIRLLEADDKVRDAQMSAQQDLAAAQTADGTESSDTGDHTTTTADTSAGSEN